jgi:predicted aspartyl protease
VKVTTFNPGADLILVSARVLGASGSRLPLRVAIDTGSSETTVRPEFIDMLGYSPRDGEKITTVRAALGKEHGYTLRVARFTALGYSIPDFQVHVFDLPEGLGLDGLIGLSFLRRFNYQVRSAEGRIVVEPVTAA